MLGAANDCAAAQPGSANGADATSCRILLIDDDAALRTALLRVLSQPERQFFQAGSVGEALGLLERERFDLLILDYRLPDASGLELLGWLRGQRREEAVVMISGEDTMDAVIGALRGGVDDFIRKPYHVAQIQRTVQNALHKSALSRANQVMSQRLHESERLHRYLVERSPDFIFALDADGCFSFANLRASALTGLEREALIGRPLHELVVAEDRPALAALLAQARAGHGEAVEAELRLLRPATSSTESPQPWFPAMLSVLPMRPQSGGAPFAGYHGIVRDLSAQKHAEEQLAFRAYHDSLTGLPNRLLLRDRLALAIAQAERRDCALTLIYLDMDRFRLINDSYGHDEGDALLAAIAGRLSAVLRQGDTLARFGADEFIVLLPDTGSAQDAEIVAHKLLTALHPPFSLRQGGQLHASASIGVALYPRDGQSSEELLRHADLAMQRAKRAGRNGLRFFDPSLNAQQLGRLGLEYELRQAIAAGQLELHYQPQVSLKQQRITGVEALLRWNHPRHGQLTPNHFIALAEESDLIVELSAWVLDTALAQLAAWQRRGQVGLRMSLNLSARDFAQADLPERVSASLAAHQLAPSGLEIEITESTMMEDVDEAAARVAALRKLGVGVSIDDFGTGYSSLAYLQRFPISGLKIDRSFVRDLRDGASNPIIGAITGIARGFGLHVVAEGVEAAEQARLLARMGCDLMQGYHFGRPMPAYALEQHFGPPSAR